MRKDLLVAGRVDSLLVVDLLSREESYLDLLGGLLELGEVQLALDGQFLSVLEEEHILRPGEIELDVHLRGLRLLALLDLASQCLIEQFGLLLEQIVHDLLLLLLLAAGFVLDELRVVPLGLEHKVEVLDQHRLESVPFVGVLIGGKAPIEKFWDSSSAISMNLERMKVKSLLYFSGILSFWGC